MRPEQRLDMYSQDHPILATLLVWGLMLLFCIGVWIALWAVGA